MWERVIREGKARAVSRNAWSSGREGLKLLQFLRHPSIAAGASELWMYSHYCVLHHRGNTILQVAPGSPAGSRAELEDHNHASFPSGSWSWREQKHTVGSGSVRQAGECIPQSSPPLNQKLTAALAAASGTAAHQGEDGAGPEGGASLPSGQPLLVGGGSAEAVAVLDELAGAPAGTEAQDAGSVFATPAAPPPADSSGSSAAAAVLLQAHSANTTQGVAPVEGQEAREVGAAAQAAMGEGGAGEEQVWGLGSGDEGVGMGLPFLPTVQEEEQGEGEEGEKGEVGELKASSSRQSEPEGEGAEQKAKGEEEKEEEEEKKEGGEEGEEEEEGEDMDEAGLVHLRCCQAMYIDMLMN